MLQASCGVVRARWVDIEIDDINAILWLGVGIARMPRAVAELNVADFVEPEEREIAVLSDISHAGQEPVSALLRGSFHARPVPTFAWTGDKEFFRSDPGSDRFLSAPRARPYLRQTKSDLAAFRHGSSTCIRAARTSKSAFGCSPSCTTRSSANCGRSGSDGGSNHWATIATRNRECAPARKIGCIGGT